MLERAASGVVAEPLTHTDPVPPKVVRKSALGKAVEFPAPTEQPPALPKQ